MAPATTKDDKFATVKGCIREAACGAAQDGLLASVV